MWNVLKGKLDLGATGCAIALGFAIPVSTAATNLLFFLFLLLFLVSGNYAEKSRRVMQNPITLPVLLFCGLCLFGTLYGPGEAKETLHALLKYLVLLVAPLLAAQLTGRAGQFSALLMFCAAMLLTLFISCLIGFHLMPERLLAQFPEHIRVTWSMDNPVVFKLHITQSFMMAVAAFILFILSKEARSSGLRWLAVGLGLLAAFNVLAMVKGRTGYLVIAVFIVYYFGNRFSKKGLATGLLLTLMLAMSGYQYSASFRERVQLTLAEANGWQAGQGSQTSIGQRLDYYTTSLAIIQKHPWLGVGTGGFKSAYQAEVQGTKTPPSDNPHNQYLMVTAQLGLVGLLALLFFYFRYWQGAQGLAPPFLQISQGILLAYLAANLFNSFMLDFSERFFFVWVSGVLFGAGAGAVEKPPATVKPGVTG